MRKQRQPKSSGSSTLFEDVKARRVASILLNMEGEGGGAGPVDIFTTEYLDTIKNDPDKLNDFIDKATLASEDADSESIAILMALTFDASKKLRSIPKADSSLNFEILTIEELNSILGDREAAETYLNKIQNALRMLESTKSDKKSLLEYQQQAILNSLQNAGSTNVFRDRVAPISFGVKSEALLHDYDLQRIAVRVVELFDWHTDVITLKRYMAPYFPLVQSSGSGKTKILWELQELVNNNKNKQFEQYDCRSIICLDSISTDKDADKSIYSNELLVVKTTYDVDRENIRAKLNEILQGCRNERVIFLFDESQHLLQSEGWSFRCVRWWLREKTRENKQVVAVFTGTTSRLTNFYADPPRSTTSGMPPSEYFESGPWLYPPFYNLYTTGIYASEPSPVHAQNDYERAVPHGRPLFAAVQKNGTLTEDREADILGRMLITKAADWGSSLSACFSILGTRIQLGQTSVALASTFVASAYATLTYFAVPSRGQDVANIATICFETDPVCARLAMCMMDADFIIPSGTRDIRGKDKCFWTSKICEIFSTGLCLPNQGGVGELAGASYLLFCGDLLRKRIDPRYRTFSVPLTEFVECLVGQNDGSTTASGTKKRISKKKTKYTEAHVSFIQVVRNYMRFPIGDLERLDVLKDMYTAGIAYYTYPNCPVFDMVASIRLTAKDMSFCYVPMLISISTKSDSAANSIALKNLTQVFNETKTFGLGIRLVFDKPHGNSSEILSPEDVKIVLNGGNVSKVVVVPRDDQFGIVASLLDIVSFGPVEAEIDSSKYFLRTKKLRSRYDQAQLLRKNEKSQMKKYLKGAIDKKIPDSKVRKGRKKKDPTTS